MLQPQKGMKFHDMMESWFSPKADTRLKDNNIDELMSAASANLKAGAQGIMPNIATSDRNKILFD